MVVKQICSLDERPRGRQVEHVGSAAASHEIEQLAGLLRQSRSTVAPDGRGDLGALRDTRLPLAGDGAVGESRPDGGRPHRRLS
jgi:hypothetical protein